MIVINKDGFNGVVATFDPACIYDVKVECEYEHAEFTIGLGSVMMYIPKNVSEGENDFIFTIKYKYEDNKGEEQECQKEVSVSQEKPGCSVKLKISGLPSGEKATVEWGDDVTEELENGTHTHNTLSTSLNIAISKEGCTFTPSSLELICDANPSGETVCDCGTPPVQACTVTFNIGGSYNYIHMVALMNPSSGGGVYQLNGTGSSRTAEIACGITFTGIVFNDVSQQHCAYFTNSTGGTITDGASFSATITGTTCQG